MAVKAIAKPRRIFVRRRSCAVRRLPLSFAEVPLTAPAARFIPHPRLHEVDHVAVAADPAEAWCAVQALTIAERPWVRACVTDEGRSITVVAEPTFGKVAWSIEVSPRGDGGSWIVSDLRADAASEEARGSFLPYWLSIGPLSRTVRRRILRQFARRLGRPLPDTARVLPADQLIVAPRTSITDGITIAAPRTEVWPWLAERHDIWPRSNDSARFVVLDLERHRALVLGSPNLLANVDAPAPSEGAPYVVTWTFYLEPIGSDLTRLIVRVRADFAPTPVNELGRPFLRAAHTLLESAQLWHLKQRAETLGRVEIPA